LGSIDIKRRNVLTNNRNAQSIINFQRALTHTVNNTPINNKRFNSQGNNNQWLAGNGQYWETQTFNAILVSNVQHNNNQLTTAPNNATSIKRTITTENHYNRSNSPPQNTKAFHACNKQRNATQRIPLTAPKICRQQRSPRSALINGSIEHTINNAPRNAWLGVRCCQVANKRINNWRHQYTAQVIG
jgi:hypothetical protein